MTVVQGWLAPLWSLRASSLVPRSLLTALVAVAVVAAPLRFVAGRPSSPARSMPSVAHARSGLDALPLQAQGVISTALGAADPAFRATHTSVGYRAHGGGVGVDVTHGGVDLIVATGSIRLSLTGIGHGDNLQRVGPGSTTVHRNRVAVAHRIASEWYAGGPLGVEQGLTVNRRPAGNNGALTLHLVMRGSLLARYSDQGLTFQTRTGRTVLRLGGLSAVDASGRSLRSALILQPGQMLLRVADARARYPVRIDPFIQQGTKLNAACTLFCSGPNGTGESGGPNGSFLGWSAALSADGNTALVGAVTDDSNVGAAWVFTRSGGSWSQQGPKLVANCTTGCGGASGTGEVGQGTFGWSVALSADGNTALIGARNDDSANGAAWVFTRSGGSWSQQGAKLVGGCTSACGGPNGTGGTAGGRFGQSVALSADGNTALIGGPSDGVDVGAAWVFTRSNLTWTQQGAKLVGDCMSACFGPNGTGESGDSEFATGVALASDGNTALIGVGGGDGAAWVFTRSGGTWSQQGAKLVGDCTSACGGPNGTGETGEGHLGLSVALSGDGNTALVGASFDHDDGGAAWVFTRSDGTWSQQGPKLVGDCTSACGGPDGTGESGAGSFGSSLALSFDGNTALIGAPFDGNGGATWSFGRVGGAWSQESPKLVGDCTGACTGPNGTGESGQGEFGFAAALSSDGTTALISAASDNSIDGAAWVFTDPAPCSDVGASTAPGGGLATIALSCSAPPSASITYSIVTSPAHGALEPINQSNGQVTYISQPGYVGSDSFTYEATDSAGAANVATATINVPPLPPAPPTCVNVTAKTRAGGGAASVKLSCRAPAGVPFSYAIVASPAHGTVSAIAQGSGELVYVSRLGYHGTDHFTYRASDAGGASRPAVATITVPKPLGTLAFSLLGWFFNPAHAYSTISSMTGSDLPVGTKVSITCHGGRCRFKPHSATVRAGSQCKRKHPQCTAKTGTRSIDLTPLVRHSRYPAGAGLTVSFTKPGYVGKVWIFHIRPGRLPMWRATCLAPGSLTPGRGC
jgi:Bacterial Ig domain/FG-GAP repeat